MDAVDTYLSTYPGSPIVLDVLGTLDGDEIRARVRELDPGAVEIFSFAASVGALFGIRRDDGSRVAMKIHKLFRDERFLDDLQTVQRALVDRGFPAPRPLGRQGYVTWEAWQDQGVFVDAHDPRVRRVLARTLARLVELATATGVRPRRPLELLPGGLWPVPHNALFDFGASHEGAEWIDEIARNAAAARDAVPGREVVGHTDWAVKHLRFDAELHPTVVYDWDSLDTQSESRIVGSAAASFVYTEELEVESLWPSVEESLAFIAEYEEARGKPFTDAERSAVHGAAVYLGAYVARCHWAHVRQVNRGVLEELASALLQ
ncbi:MAG TPA: hypothetical protein VHV52_02125 [Gaiellaceae bacterium]|nr:hypothetical protein [Gaiellaceae bacterium]